MNLQIALDRLTEDECFRVLKETEEFVDWIEVGTGVIKEYGMSIVKKIRAAYPNKMIVADMKTCDAGKHEAVQAFEAGADITTVMAFSADQTIQDMVEVANQYDKRVMVDLLGITNQDRIKELRDLNIDLVSLHFGKDMQQSNDLEGSNILDLIRDYQDLEVAVAGGINLTSLPKLLEYEFETFIVGSAITKQPDMRDKASSMKGLMNQYETNHHNSGK